MVARRVHTSSTPVRGVNLYQCPALPPGHRSTDGTRRYTVKSERAIRGITLFALFPNGTGVQVTLKLPSNRYRYRIPRQFCPKPGEGEGNHG